MVKKLLAWLFYGKCEVCGERKKDIHHFHDYRVDNIIVEDICEDCVRIEELKRDPGFHRLVEDSLRDYRGY